MRKKIDIISMGCSKNLIDSERIIRRLSAKGYDVEHNPEVPEGDYIVVNTCGFIADAKEESIAMILDLVKAREEGQIGKIIVMGCLSERYAKDMPELIPEVDMWYGKYNWKDFIDTLPNLGDLESEKPKDWERIITTPPHSAYIKISEGCNRFCAFCAIPIITGRHTSRPRAEIIEEVRDLVSRGVREFNVIAQDLSSYGIDTEGKHTLAALIEEMSDVPGVEWIRLHYAYPADFPEDILRVMRERKNVCRYLDIALQHISDTVLTNMRRHISKQETLDLIAKIRREVPGIKIRTTLMVGFPGEGEKEFEELLDFVRTQKFDRMGAFAYSEEEDTFAAKNLDDSINEEVKQKRLDTLMNLQEEISAELQEKMVGQRIRVLVDRIEGDTAIARSEWDSPEVDPEVLIPAGNLKPGQFVDVIITKAFPFELEGEVAGDAR